MCVDSIGPSWFINFLLLFVTMASLFSIYPLKVFIKDELLNRLIIPVCLTISIIFMVLLIFTVMTQSIC